jgi:integrase
MSHKPYNLYKRPTKRPGKNIYYVQFYDESGKRMTAVSSGQTSKAAAETWAIEQLKRGLITPDKDITFAQFARDFWVWDRCAYVKSRHARGADISRRYVESMRGYLQNHILPYFSDRKLQKISASMIEKWIMDLRDKSGKDGGPLSPTTVNRCFTCFKIMLKEAVRLEYLHKSPALGITQLREKPEKRSILTIEEVRELFQDDEIDRVWNGDLRHYTLNLLAATTGMRLGEVQALQVQHVHEEYITVLFSWDKKYGLREPKWGSQREIPIPSRSSTKLAELIALSPFQEPNDFVFFGKDRKTPMRDKTISGALYNALQTIRISEDERRERYITFHSWRHFYNSLMRGKIHDAKLRRLTGHKTLEMTERYTHFNLEDFKDVVRIQEEYFS